MGENIVTAEFFYSNVSNFTGIWLLSVTIRVDGNPWVLTMHLHEKSRNSGWDNQMVRAIPFGKLQKIWAVF